VVNKKLLIGNSLALISVIFFIPIAFAVSCGDTITSNTTLTGNLTDCTGTGLEIGANSIVIDCAGYSITGSSGLYGIDIYQQHSITIKNCTIQGFSEGINFDQTYNDNFTRNIVSNNAFGGISGNCNNTSITYNTANNEVNGLDISGYNNVIFNNIANNNSQVGLDLLYDSNNVTNNTFNNNIQYGIAIGPGSYNNIINNIVSNNSNYGIGVSNFTNNIITDNKVNYNNWGIRFTSSSTNNVMTGNKFCSNTILDVIFATNSIGNTGDSRCTTKQDPYGNAFTCYSCSGYLIMLQPGYTFTLSDNTDVTVVPQNISQTVYVTKTGTGLVGELGIDFSAATDDITLPTIISDTSLSEGKAVMHNLASYPSTVTNKWLLVPETTGSPYHCPSATSLAEVTTGCSGVDLSPTYTEVSIDGHAYYRMANQGGGNNGGSGGGDSGVPEFSDYALIAMLALVGLGFFSMGKKHLLNRI
jgi:parallel beta-helix repeat protein